MKLGIVGSRDRATRRDYDLILEKVQELNPSVIVSGGCYIGADAFAEDIAILLTIPKKIFPPEWKIYPYHIYGNKAYNTRNMQIADYSDVLIALPSSKRRGGINQTIDHFLTKSKAEDLILL